MIIITRPLFQALRTQEKLQYMGHESIVYPVMKVETKKGWELQIPDKDYDGVIITSQNAADIVKNHQLVLTKPLYVVGSMSAKILKGRDVRYIAEDSHELEEFLKKQKLKKLLFFCGDYIVNKLSDAAKRVDRVIVYTATPTATLPLDLTKFAKCIMLYSPRSAYILKDLVKGRSLKNCIALCLSQAVADIISDLDWKDIRVAKRPNELSLFQQLYKF